MTSTCSLTVPYKRPATPDSACEQDWTPAIRTGVDNDFTAESHYPANNNKSSQKFYPACTTGGLTNDSDGDSGIVTVRHNQRTGSTSSTDTENSQETSARNLSYLLENHYVVLRKGTKGPAVQQCSNGPIKGDHSIFASNNNTCNKASTATRLSLFEPKDQQTGSQHLVRFDDELQLTEQSIRRSCRKLFAALYAQKPSITSPSGDMPTCHHRTSVNIPLTTSSYPCCRNPTFHRTVSNQESASSASSASQNPPKIRSNSVSETRRQGTSSVYKLCQNIYSQKDAKPDMVQVFARPAAVIPMTEHKQAPPAAVPSSDNERQIQETIKTEMLTSVKQQEELAKKVEEIPERNDASDSDFPAYHMISHTISRESRDPIGTSKSISMPQLQMQNGTDHRQDSLASSEVEYAVVDKTKKLRKNEPYAISHPCLSKSLADDAEPPVPPKKFMHRSDFALYQGPNNSSKKSFLGRIQGLTKSAKSAIQKAFSTERIYRPQQEEEIDASGRKKPATFIKGLKNRVSMRNKKKTPNVETVRIESTSSSPLWGVDATDRSSLEHVCGQLLQLNVDGSQVIELTRPQGKPFGFFVARGRVKTSRGVFVSRMRDQETQKLLSGLVDVGDEILEIDGFNVKDSDIIEVNGLMAKKLTLLLTILPYICRKDI